MATSLADLLGEIRDSAHAAGVDALSAGQAITALGHIARGVTFLADAADNADRTASVLRWLVVRDVASACNRAALGWPVTDGRLPELAAVTADLVARRAPRLDEGERWLLIAELNQAARGCIDAATRFPPYAGLLALARAGRAVARCAQLNPPDGRRRTILDDLVPPARVSPHGSASRQVTDAVAGLAHALAVDRRDRALHLYAALAASAAAESVTSHAAALGESLADGRRAGVWVAAPQAWRVMQAALIHFDDGSRYSIAAPSAVTAWALQLHRAVDALPARPATQPELAETVTAVRCAVNQMPTIAGHVEAAVQRWAAEARLFARARTLPSSERHVSAVIHNQVTIVTAQDVAPVVRAARVAGRLSTALAVELDRTAGRIGHQPQRHLAAALAASPLSDRLSRDAQWAGRLAARCQTPTPAAARLGR